MECGMSVWMELLGRCFLREGEAWGEGRLVFGGERVGFWWDSIIFAGFFKEKTDVVL